MTTKRKYNVSNFILAFLFAAIGVSFFSLYQSSNCAIIDASAVAADLPVVVQIKNTATKLDQQLNGDRTIIQNVVDEDPIIIIKQNEKDERHPTKSRPNTTPSATTATASSTTSTTKCTGTPKERRELVQNQQATAKDWNDMTRCVLERHSTMYGHFALHVSKAGGSSLCESFKSGGNQQQQQQCRQIPSRKERHKTKTNYDYNCWLGQKGNATSDRFWQKQTFSLGPRWARASATREMKLDSWMGEVHDDNIIPCTTLVDHFQREDNMVVFSENHLIRGNLCPSGMLNSIVVREPISRLLSHYNDVYLWCMKYKYNPRCLKMLVGGNVTTDGVRVYDTMFMVKNFDFITDNVYARSLNDNRVYYAPLGFEGMDSNDILSSALKSLEEMDWVIVLGSGNSTADKENNDLILTRGLGLSQGLPHSNKVGAKAKDDHSKKASGMITPEGLIFFKKLNDLDYQIWEEAKRLHRLDVESLKLMQKHGENVITEYNNKKRKQKGDYCCGYICKTPNELKK